MADIFLCTIPGCGKPMLQKSGLCNSHYLRKRRHGDPLAGGAARERYGPVCRVEGCEKSIQGGGKGYCGTHYQRFRTHGDPLKGARTPRGRCSIDGCDNIHSSHGYCVSHLARLQRHGDPLYGGALKKKAKPGAPLSWLLAHADYDDEGCLPWPFGRDSAGYGVLLFDEKDDRAHRVMCTIAHGKPPTPTHEAAHNCGKGHEGCVHPGHLRWDTRLGNQLDKDGHGTLVRGEDVWCAKLTEDQVRYIRSRENKDRICDLADRFGVNRMTIKHILIRKNWAWLE